MTAVAAIARRRNPLGLVIFDCDGVLVDSETVANTALAHALTQLGWQMTAAETEACFIGLNLEAMVPIIEVQLNRALPSDWVADMTAMLVDTLGRESTAIAGAIEALHALSAMDVKWRVASNSSHEEMIAKFACLGVSGLVAGRVHSYQDVAQGKPAPDLFLATAAAERVAPAACLVIEDSVVGARAAAAATMDCLGYAPHGDGAALRAAGAGIFRSMFDLPGLIASAARGTS